MILFLITKLMAIALAIYVVRRVRHTKYQHQLWKFTTLAGIGFVLLAVAPLVLNVPKILSTASIDLAILCLSMSAILYVFNRNRPTAGQSPTHNPTQGNP